MGPGVGMTNCKKLGAIADLMSSWGEVIFSADDIDRMRVQLEEVLLCRAESESPDELAHYANQGPAAWVGERVRRVLIANDSNWTGKPLLSLAEVEDEVFAHSGPVRSAPIEDALIDALLAAMQLRAANMPPSDGPALIWRFCYRLAQVATLVADAGRDEALRKGKRGGPKDRGDVGEAKNLARRFLWEKAFDSAGEIRPQKVLELEVWEMLFARRNEPAAFQIAGGPGCPTDRAIKTVRSFISQDYRRMRTRGKAGLEHDHVRSNEYAVVVYARRNSRLREVDATPDASPE